MKALWKQTTSKYVLMAGRSWPYFTPQTLRLNQRPNVYQLGLSSTKSSRVLYNKQAGDADNGYSRRFRCNASQSTLGNRNKYLPI